MVRGEQINHQTFRASSGEPAVYTQPNCPGCENVKRFFSDRGISFLELDISSDGTAAEEFARLGRPATPVTVIGDIVVWGFNRRALTGALGLDTNF